MLDRSIDENLLKFIKTRYEYFREKKTRKKNEQQPTACSNKNTHMKVRKKEKEKKKTSIRKCGTNRGKFQIS